MTLARCFSNTILLSAFVFLFFGSLAQAQNPSPPDEKTLQSLLQEVRLLRETLQRTNANAYRAQILLERIRTQNERIARLTHTLEDTRNEVSNLQAEINQRSEQAKDVERQIQQGSELTQRSQLEDMQKQLALFLDQQKQKLQRVQARESQINTDLQTEQGKLIELEGRLDALEREFQGALDKQRPNKP